MAKESGLGWTTTSDPAVGGSPNDVSNDVLSLTLATPKAVQDITGLDKSAHERLTLLADFSCNLTVAFNDASNRAFATFKAVEGPKSLSNAISGQTLAVEALQTDFGFNRGAGGEVTNTVPFVLQSGTVPAWA